MIARGGMATVYRGFDERLHRPVALKIMHPHLADNPEFITRFSREARSAARLTHPHVVSVYDQGEDQGRVYLAMQLVDGETLRDELRRDGTLTLRRALRVGRDVLAALDAAHRSGIIHRDIKPENVLVNSERDILVADFGVARAVGSATTSATGTMLGTVAYVSPEVVTRGVSDARSDLYSWGIMMFEMLTGRTPFQGDSAVHIAYQHAHEDIPAPSSLAPQVPASIDALITWAAARVPASRPARALEVLQALDEALDTLTPEQLSTRAPLPSTDHPGRDLTTSNVPRLTRDIDPLDSAGPAPAGSAPSGAAAGGFGAATGIDLLDITPEPAPVEHDYAGLTAFLASTRGAGSDGADERGTQMRQFTAVDPDADESIRELSLRARTRAVGWRTRRPRHSPLMSLLALVALAAALVGLAVAAQQWYVSMGPGADRAVPILAGASLEDAESALTSSGLEIATMEAFSEDVPEGHVISSDPGAGTVVKRGSTVRVVISKGEQLFAVPAVDGTPVAEARAALEALGFTVSEEREFSDTVPKDAVIRHEATADALPQGAPVTLIVSDGPEPLPIPSTVGQTREAATASLEGAGFTVSATTAYSGSVPSGSVISQEPGSGTGVRGQEVSIVVSQGPEMLTVPNVFQKPEAEAKAELEAAGFTVSVVYDRGTPIFGLVYQQSTAGGAQAPRDSTITINVF